MNAAIDTEVFQEILYRYHHINFPDKRADLAWSMMELGLNVLPVIKKDIEVSLYFYQQYRDKGVLPREIIHAATMVQNGLETIVSVGQFWVGIFKYMIEMILMGEMIPEDNVK